MSQHGSFVTEYIHCEVCLAAALKILNGDTKYLFCVHMPSWSPNEAHLPIISGKVGGLYLGEELHTFEYEINPKLEAVICHPLRIAVLAESGDESRDAIFRLVPDKLKS